MSERSKYRGPFFGALIVMAILTGLAAWDGVVERQRGRAEQKKWDADWYQRNPVVKEVPPKFTFDGAGIESECYVVDAGHLRCNFTKGVGFVGARSKGQP